MSLCDETKKPVFTPGLVIKHEEHAEIERKTAEFLKRNKITVLASDESADKKGISMDRQIRIAAVCENNNKKLLPIHLRK